MFFNRLLALFITFLALIPILGLLAGLIDPPQNPFIPITPTFSTLFAQSRIWQLIFNTFSLGILVTTIAVVVGTWLAWIEQRYRYPGRSLLAILCLLPMAVPSYVLASTLRYSLSPGGWLGEFLGLPIFKGFFPAVLVLTIVTIPYVHLLVSAALKRASLTEEEAAKNLGAGRKYIFFHIILPHLRPAIAYAGLLSLLYVISDFGSVAILDTQVLTWRLYQAFEHQQLAKATLFGIMILTMAIPVLIIARWVHSHINAPQISNPRHIERTPLTSFRLLSIYLIQGLIIFIGLGLPLSTLLGWIWAGWSNDLVFASLKQPLWDTFIIGIFGTLIILIAAFPPAWAATRGPRWLRVFIENGIYITSALPGILLAFGLLLAALLSSRGLGFSGTLYQTLLNSGILLILGYLMHFIAKAYAGLKTSMVQLDPRLIDSAKVLGASPYQWMKKIVLPTLWPGIVTGFILVLLALIKELPITLLLGNAMGIRTLSFRIFDRYQEAFLHDAGLASLILLVLSFTIVLITLRWRQHV